MKKESKKNKKTNKIISVFKCCLVKSTHHLGGYISCKTKRIKFNYSLEENEENEEKEHENKQQEELVELINNEINNSPKKIENLITIENS